MILIPSVRIKKLVDGAVVPSYAREGDAGMDLVAVRKWYDDYGNVCYGTGLAFEIPPGYVGLLFPRSSNSKKDLFLCNSVGVLDSGYRGEVTFKFKRNLKIVYNYIDGMGGHSLVGLNDDDYEEYEVGDRIGQIIILPYPYITFVEVDELSDSERGEGGFGSTGK